MLLRERHRIVALEEDGAAEADGTRRGRGRGGQRAARRRGLRGTYGAKGRYRRRAAWRIMLLTCMTRAPSISRHAWLVVALLIPVALLNYLDRQMLASMKFSVMRDVPDIALEANWGAILATFKWVYAGLSPVGGYLADRYSPAPRHRRQPAGLVARDVDDRPCDQLRSAARDPRAHGRQRGVLHSRRAGPDRRRAPRLDAVARRRPPSDGDLSRRHRRRVRRLRGRPSRPRLALGLRRLRPRRDHLRACRSSSCSRRPSARGARRQPQPPSPGRARAAGAARQRLVPAPRAYFTLPALAGWIVRDWMPAILKAEFGIGQGLAGVSATLYWQVAAIAGALGRRLARRSLDAPQPARPDLRERHRHGADRARHVRRRLCAAKPAACGWRSPS